MKVKGSKVAYYSLFAVILCAFSPVFVYYVSLAGSRVPIMDYWEWIADYGPRFADHSISIWDFVVNPGKSPMSAQHISPGSMALQMWILHISKYDVRVLVLLGTGIRLIVGWIIAFYFLVKNFDAYKSRFTTFWAGILLFMAYINLNQWEVLSQPFTFSIRMALYLFSFIWAQKYYNELSDRTTRSNIIHTFLLGGYCALLTILFSSAYFVGHLFAIILLGLVKYIRSVDCKRKVKLQVLLFSVIQIVGVLIYFGMMNLSANSGGGTAGISFKVTDVIQGVFVFMGSLIVPQSYVEACGYIPAMAVGIFIFVILFIAIILYFKLGLDKEYTFPLMCVVYAGTTAATIAVGRISAFGVGTMNSSRYVVEGTVGLIGLIMMCYRIMKTLEDKAGIYMDKIILKRWCQTP